MNKFKFENLIICEKSMDYSESNYQISTTFPDIEKFNLASQILRASDSIALNISEGSIGQSNAEQQKFIGYSIRSLAEVITCLRRNYISNDKFTELYDEAYLLMNMMIAFRKNIK